MRRNRFRHGLRRQRDEQRAFEAATERIAQGNPWSRANVVRAYERNKRRLLGEPGQPT